MEKKLVTQNNQGFTLVEMLISLSLLSIFILLLSSIVSMTTLTSQKFLDYSDYEYAMMHKKVFQLYEDTRKVSHTKSNIIFINEKENREHKIVFTSQKIYKQTKNPGENFASGYSLLLDNIQSYTLETKEDTLIIKVIDRAGKTRTIKLFLKDKIKEDKEKDAKQKKEQEEADKNRLEEESLQKSHAEEMKKLLDEHEKYKQTRRKELEILLEKERNLTNEDKTESTQETSEQPR